MGIKSTTKIDTRDGIIDMICSAYGDILKEALPKHLNKYNNGALEYILEELNDIAMGGCGFDNYLIKEECPGGKEYRVLYPCINSLDDIEEIKIKLKQGEIS